MLPLFCSKLRLSKPRSPAPTSAISVIQAIACESVRSILAAASQSTDLCQADRKVRPSATSHSLHLTADTVLQRVAGKDASKQFWKYHNEGILKKYKGQLQVGSLDSKKQASPPTPPATPPPATASETNPSEVIKPKAEVVKPQAESGTVAPVAGKDAKQVRFAKESLDPYGDLVPYADPSWYQSVCPTMLMETSIVLIDDTVSLSLFQRVSCSSPRRSSRLG